MGQEVGKGEASRDFLKLTLSMFLDKSGLPSQQFFISEQRQDRLHLNTIFGSLLQCNCFVTSLWVKLASLAERGHLVVEGFVDEADLAVEQITDESEA